MKENWITRALLGLVLTIGITMLIFLCFLSGGCTRKVYVPMESVRTEYREADTTGLFNRIAKLFESRKEKEVKIDSVVERSKETVVLNEKGDTTKHFQYLYIHLSTKERQKLEDMIAERDSTIKDLRAKKSEIKHDSIPVPYPVEKELSRWQQAKMDAGGIAMGAAGVLFIALCIAVWWIKKKRK